MQLSLFTSKRFLSGALFVAFGVLALVISRDYRTGSAVNMGPGYFPRLLGGLLVVLGGTIAGLSVGERHDPIGGAAWRPMLALSLGLLCFGWAMTEIGFVLALSGLVLCVAFAGRDVRLVELAALVGVLVGGCVGLFVFGLGLPFRLFWW